MSHNRRPIYRIFCFSLGMLLGLNFCAVPAKAQGQDDAAKARSRESATALQRELKEKFPKDKLTVTAINGSVVVSGFVKQAESVAEAEKIAEKYFPKVINQITVGGVQQVQLKVKVMEVSRTQLREMKFDWPAEKVGSDSVVSSISGLVTSVSSSAGTGIGPNGDKITFGKVTGNKKFVDFLEDLGRFSFAKVMAEPTITTVSGRPASFNVGSEIPILVPAKLGDVKIEYKETGTRVDALPTLLKNGKLQLEMGLQVGNMDPWQTKYASNVQKPAWKYRINVDTTVEIKPDETLALAGLAHLSKSDLAMTRIIHDEGKFFGSIFESFKPDEVIELVVLVTPKIVDPLPPDEVPAGGPGGDAELYGKGYLEVPKAAPFRTRHDKKNHQ